MTFLLEPIGQEGLEKIQRDLQSQEKYKDLQVNHFLSSGTNQRWAIDSKRNRYLHSIRRFGASHLRPYHFFFDGISYEIEIPDSICRPQYSAHIYASNDADDHASLLKVLPAIQEAFDTFGSCGFGPDEEGWPGFYRVELTLSAERA